MSTFVWTMQILVAGLFLYAGVCTVFAKSTNAEGVAAEPTWKLARLPRELAYVIGLAEIVGALCLILPAELLRWELIQQFAAGGLALLAVSAAIYHMRRREPSSHMLALFLLVLFVIIGRLP